MTAKRQPDGATLYRGRRIDRHDEIPACRPGRYTVDGKPFSQLGHAKAWIDQTSEAAQ